MYVEVSLILGSASMCEGELTTNRSPSSLPEVIGANILATIFHCPHPPGSGMASRCLLSILYLSVPGENGWTLSGSSDASGRYYLSSWTPGTSTTIEPMLHMTFALLPTTQSE
jgi:hypothetical protein